MTYHLARFLVPIAVLLCSVSVSGQEMEIAGVPTQAAIRFDLSLSPNVSPARGPTGIISTIAGTGRPGLSGNGGPATSAEFIDPTGVVVDSKGNLYVADADSNMVRKISRTNGIIEVFAGSGEGGYSGDGGLASEAELLEPNALAIDSHGNIFISDSGNSVIRRVDAVTGKISTVAGDGYPASPITGLQNCGPIQSGLPATKSDFCGLLAVAVDSADNLYISDENSVVYKVDAKSRITTIIAGDGGEGYYGDGGPANSALVTWVDGIALDKSGNVFLSDEGNCTIRRIDAKTGIITSLIGDSRNFSRPCGYSGNGGPAAKAAALDPAGIAIDANNDIYFADAGNRAVRVIAAASHDIYAVAGGMEFINFNGNFGFGGDGGPAAGAAFTNAYSVAFDPAGDLYISDNWEHVIRKVANAKVSPASAPTITPLSGAVSFPLTVTLKAARPGEAVYYTTNGSVPTTASRKYTVPFTISDTSIVTAFSPGAPNSPASVAYFFDAPPPVLHVNGTANDLPKGSKLTITDANPRARIAFTSNGYTVGDPRANLALYTGPIALPTGATTIMAYAWTSTKDASGQTAGMWSEVTQGNFVVVEGSGSPQK
jgi:trimeric autotransporter adhesin